MDLWRTIIGQIDSADFIVADVNDLERIVSLVDDLKYVQMPRGHEIHMVQAGRYVDESMAFFDDLGAQGRLPSTS